MDTNVFVVGICVDARAMSDGTCEVLGMKFCMHVEMYVNLRVLQRMDRSLMPLKLRLWQYRSYLLCNIGEVCWSSITQHTSVTVAKPPCRPDGGASP